MSDTDIQRILGRRIWDSRGRPTVEAEVQLRNGVVGRGIAPAGASRGALEAIDLRDGGTALGGFGVAQAVANVNGVLAHELKGLDARQQAVVDARICALDGTANMGRLGGNASIAVSLAVLHAAAAAGGAPLWQHLAGAQDVRMPLPQIQIFGGGAHAGRRIDIQDLLVMPVGARNFDEALVMVAEVYRAAGALMQDSGRAMGVADEGGWWPAFDTNEEALEMLVRAIDAAGYGQGEVQIALDIAASEFGHAGRYTLGLEGRVYDSDGWCELLGRWLERYPIVSIEDPLAEDDEAGMVRFTRAFGQRVQVVGDDFLCTSAERVRAAARAGACNAVLIKPNQAGTVSQTQDAMQAARELGWGRIVSARSGETEDTTIIHLAVGWDTGQFKVGSFARSERMAKWNEALRIEEAMGAAARYAGGQVLARSV